MTDTKAQLAPAWVGITYAIYCVGVVAIVWGSTAYAVFALGQSGWWFVLAVVMLFSMFKPRRWRQIWDGRALDPEDPTK